MMFCTGLTKRLLSTICSIRKRRGGMRLKREALQSSIAGTKDIGRKEVLHVNLTNESVLSAYKHMLFMRRLEEKVGQLYGMGLIRGFCHLYIGQEAVAAGMYSVLQPSDSVITSYREHGFALSSGESPGKIIAELLGRSAGSSKGKGGSMHIFNVQKNFYGGHGIVGAQVPIGTGIAFANKYKANGGVVFTCLGDGAINQGQVYEAFNMAALWKLPVVYVVENNEYAMGTSVARSSYVSDLYKRGESCGVPGRRVDGMDLFEVISEVSQAAAHCREGNGPILLEMKTYRYRGHSMSDPAKYRTREEVEEIRNNRDPLCIVKSHILEHNMASEEVLTTWEKEIRDEIKKAVEFAEGCPEPSVEELYTDVYK
ncbi:pyruvate dehydrogenase (acetyl-transferring) E1 component, alpha subunit [Anaplasma phagocytophilum str. ApMUC09]|uniref:Pyruvate dehydrogenase E1 component subunit alpha n=2 Tax=Anaplasma phagocytophilum TaxID=948 RepID=A0A0F3NAH3_ANAPH|nr:pyruvate dehydrogenase (acetyl-transferring) E1 component, alpha subunit [Anaplasma phagocytophilum str. ApMUC09]SCV62858.1 Acetoin:2,6-dichlorophenolindophenol oxidoreductase subunit alpha [Anaplasma phagocytophilum]